MDRKHRIAPDDQVDTLHDSLSHVCDCVKINSSGLFHCELWNICCTARTLGAVIYPITFNSEIDARGGGFAIFT